MLSHEDKKQAAPYEFSCSRFRRVQAARILVHQLAEEKFTSGKDKTLGSLWY